MPPIDSNSGGDPARYRSSDELDAAWAELPGPPTDVGRVALIVRRGEGGRRETLDRAALAIDGGLFGDAWGRRIDPHPETQITVMRIEVAELIANGQPLPLFGDNLFLDLDLSAANLPPGSRVRVGAAVLEVTPKPHNGCRKFQARFGPDALRFVSNPGLRDRNLRGVHMRVIAAGETAPGDTAEVLSRAAP